MAQNKTKPTQVSVDDHIAAIANEAQRADCLAIAKLMGKVTESEPTMWGPTIVGFGSYHYKYESGREGDSCLTGFAARKSEIAVYLAPDCAEITDLLPKLGKHKMGKGCLYIRRLSDVDTAVLEKLVTTSVKELQRRYR
ncbi:MAG: DUF1801 domain-containing protein [Polyangiaceae bacterium]|nr:DUF1801 domain-containing protein [Polyangiaceae bacterium]